MSRGFWRLITDTDGLLKYIPSMWDIGLVLKLVETDEDDEGFEIVLECIELWGSDYGTEFIYIYPSPREIYELYSLIFGHKAPQFDGGDSVLEWLRKAISRRELGNIDIIIRNLGGQFIHAEPGTKEKTAAYNRFTSIELSRDRRRDEPRLENSCYLGFKDITYDKEDYEFTDLVMTNKFKRWIGILE